MWVVFIAVSDRYPITVATTAARTFGYIAPLRPNERNPTPPASVHFCSPCERKCTHATATSRVCALSLGGFNRSLQT